MPKTNRKEFAQAGAYRVISLEASNCWFGFIYTMNDSVQTIEEEITAQLEGLEVMGCAGKNGNIIRI